MSDTASSETEDKVWKAVAIAGVLFALSVLASDGEVPWKNSVLFDCPPIGDEAYVALDPHEYHPDCEYFGPPIGDR